MRNFKSLVCILLIVNIFVFSTLLAWAIISKNNLSDNNDEFNNILDQSQELEDKILHSRIIKHDLSESILEKEHALKLVRDTINFKQDLISEQDNLIYKYQNKSASMINGEINRLLPSLRNRCKDAGVTITEPKNQGAFSFDDSSEKNNEYGFGFTAYDGFWPNFDKTEANLLGLQSAIIKEVVDFITAAANGNSLKIYSIKREAVGDTDKKHIGSEELVTSNLKLFGHLKNVKSLMFEVKFTGKTNQARTFLNQLRPPYCIVNFSSFRKTEDRTNEIDSGFISTSRVDKKTDILPIIHDIDSQFTFVFEYIYHIEYSTEKLFQILKDQFANKEIESKFLEDIINGIN